MQDPSLYAQINPTFPEQEHLKCPRCDSPNTKFCYYNNYNLSQPRHFCKSCKRYWTKGGALRNIPVGGASRKNTKRSSTTKKSSSSSPSPSPSSAAAAAKAASTPSSSSIASSSSSSSKSAFDQGRLDMSGNFSTLLGSSNGGHFGNLIDGVSQNGSKLHLGEFGNVHNPGSGSGEARNVDPHLGLQIGGDGDNASCWNGGNGWPGLAVYTPGSSYQTSKGKSQIGAHIERFCFHIESASVQL